MSSTRGLILELLHTSDLPIGSCDHGYYLIQSKKEYYDYIKTLNARIQGIYGRITKLTSNYAKYYNKQIECDDSDEDL
jgi:putative heme iron utilization protein